MFEGGSHLQTSSGWLQLALTATGQDFLGTRWILVTAVLQTAVAAAVVQQVALGSC